MGTPKKHKRSEELNKKIGKRLRECREEKGYKSYVLSEKANFSKNMVSYWENATRQLSWENAMILGEILNVNPAYIMYESDIKSPNINHNILDINSSFAITDNYFLQFLIASGHDIIFHVCEVYADGQPEHKIKIEQFSKLSLSDYKCKILIDDMPVEGIIVAVSVDGVKMSYGSFCFTINRLYDYIHFTFDNMKEFVFDFQMQRGNEFAGVDHIREVHNEQHVKEAIAELKEEYGEDAIELNAGEKEWVKDFLKQNNTLYDNSK